MSGRGARFWAAVLLAAVLCAVSSAQEKAPASEKESQPAVMRIWNGDVLAPFRDFDFEAGTKPLKPVRIVAARRGTFSGKVVVGSTVPIKGLTARISDLRAGGARIPASAVRVSFPPYSPRGAWLVVPKAVPMFDDLYTTPREAPLVTRTPDRKRIDYIPLNHAFQPVWVTVKVPDDARPGEYVGTLTLRIEDVRTFEVPVRLKVHDWTLPATGEYATFVELIQSPESVALKYNVPLWSDRHFELMGKSLRLMREIGSRSAYVPLICETNMGNDESMVRWIERPDGTYAYDFTVMEKYLDTVERYMGKPKIVGLVVWDIFLEGGPTNPKEVDAPKAMKDGKVERRPKVSVLKGGKVEKLALPSYTDPRSASLWKPMLEELRARLVKRGLAGTMMWGIATDYVPTKEVVAHFAGILPGVPWIHHSHSFYGGRDRKIASGGAPVAYASHVWCRRRELNPFKQRYYGWQPLKERPDLIELNLAGNLAGFGRLGADFWPVLKDKKGRVRGRISDGRFPRSVWRNLDIRVAMFAAGPDGAEATARFEMMREGVQECEARIFIEKALLDDTLRAKLGKTLTDRCQALLDDRTQGVARAFLVTRKGKQSQGNSVSIEGYETYLNWNWQERSDELYAAAAQVAAKLGTE